MRENELLAVQSDKTNRLVITEEKEFKKRVQNIVSDRETYKKVESKQTRIEKQANKIIKNVCQSLPKNQVQKLLTSGSMYDDMYQTEYNKHQTFFFQTKERKLQSQAARLKVFPAHSRQYGAQTKYIH